MTKSTLIDPVDVLLRPISVGSYVTYEMRGRVRVGEVTKISAKKLSMHRFPKDQRKAIPDIKYPYELTLVPAEDVALWIMKTM